MLGGDSRSLPAAGFLRGSGVVLLAKLGFTVGWTGRVVAAGLAGFREAAGAFLALLAGAEAGLAAGFLGLLALGADFLAAIFGSRAILSASLKRTRDYTGSPMAVQGPPRELAGLTAAALP
jgi:hypothetical protein